MLLSFIAFVYNSQQGPFTRVFYDVSIISHINKVSLCSASELTDSILEHVGLQERIYLENAYYVCTRTSQG